jgi:acyl-CoA synthetase (AMP-forming)/AMP-acid ligase II
LARPAEATAADLNAIRFTGGTIEVPKGVMLSHRSIERMAHMMVVNWGFAKEDRFLHVHPVTHASGFLAYGYMLVGACSVMQEDFAVSPERVLEPFARYGITSTFLVPTLIGSLLDYERVGDLDTSRLRHIFYGGAPITPERLRAAIDAFGSVLVQIYGSSETSFTLTTLLPSEHEFEGEPPNRLASVGRTVIGAADVRIRDDDGSFLPPGEVGEIVARGDVTMDGYWKNPALSAERKLDDGWVLTGDYGSFDEDGYLYLTPKRKEDLIITGGFNVWPAEVEAVLEEHPAVTEAAVYAVADERWGEKVCAAVVGPVELEDLREHLRSRLVKYKVPKEILLRDDPLPRGGDGVPLRSDLASAHAASPG